MCHGCVIKGNRLYSPQMTVLLVCYKFQNQEPGSLRTKTPKCIYSWRHGSVEELSYKLRCTWEWLAIMAQKARTCKLLSTQQVDIKDLVLGLPKSMLWRKGVWCTCRRKTCQVLIQIKEDGKYNPTTRAVKHRYVDLWGFKTEGVRDTCLWLLTIIPSSHGHCFLSPRMKHSIYSQYLLRSYKGSWMFKWLASYLTIVLNREC